MKYLGTAIFVFNIVWWKIAHKTKFWSATEIDLTTGRRQWEETESKNDAEWNSGWFKRALRKFTS